LVLRIGSEKGGVGLELDERLDRVEADLCVDGDLPGQIQMGLATAAITG